MTMTHDVKVTIFRQHDNRRLVGFYTAIEGLNSHSALNTTTMQTYVKWDDLEFHVNLLVLDHLVSLEHVSIRLEFKEYPTLNAYGYLRETVTHQNTGLCSLTFQIETVLVEQKQPTDDHLTAYARAMAIIKK